MQTDRTNLPSGQLGIWPVPSHCKSSCALVTMAVKGVVLFAPFCPASRCLADEFISFLGCEGLGGGGGGGSGEVKQTD